MNIDWSILDWIKNNLHCGFLDTVMPWITMLGEYGAVWIAVAAVFVISKKYRRAGILMSVALLVGYIECNLLLKNIVARERPCWADPEMSLLVPVPKDFSFPSGHSFFAALGSVMCIYADRRFGFIAVLTAILIAFSRLYLYVHFPSDVVAGLILGVATGIAVLAFGGKTLKRFDSAHIQADRVEK